MTRTAIRAFGITVPWLEALALLAGLALLVGCAAPAGPRTFTVEAKALREACYGIDKSVAVSAVTLKPLCVRRDDPEAKAFCDANRRQAALMRDALQACFVVLDQADTAPPRASFDASSFFRLLGDAVKVGLGAL